MKRLSDGEARTVKASRDFSMFKHKQFEVVARRIDCETPLVMLTVTSEVSSDTIAMTDVEALDLIDRLQRALAILPTSK